MGEPDDIEGECNAHLYIADNYGDSHGTMRCGLKPGHEGMHDETYRHRDGRVTVKWDGDDRATDEDTECSLCDGAGCKACDASFLPSEKCCECGSLEIEIVLEGIPPRPLCSQCFHSPKEPTS